MTGHRFLHCWWFISFFTIQPLFAVSITWDGGDAASQNWSSANNWRPNQVPGPNDEVIFSGQASNKNCTLDTSVAIGSITFTSSYAGAFDCNGKTLTVLFTGIDGSADFRMANSGAIIPHNGSILLTNNSSVTHDFIPRSRALMPAIVKSGSGPIRITGAPVFETSAIAVVQGDARAGSIDSIICGRLTINGLDARFTCNSAMLRVHDSVDITRGTLSAPTGASLLTVEGCWHKSAAATFASNHGTVVFAAAQPGKSIDACVFASIRFASASATAGWICTGPIWAEDVSLAAGILDLHGSTLTVDRNFTFASGGSLQFDTGGVLLFTGSNDTIDMRTCGNIGADSPDDKIVFEPKNAGTQIFLPPSIPHLLPRIEHNGLSGATIISGARVWTKGVTVSGKTLDLSRADVDIDGDLKICDNGYLIAPDSAHTCTIAGNFGCISPGSFANNSGTMLFDADGGQMTIYNNSASFGTMEFAGAGSPAAEWTFTSNITARSLNLHAGTLHLGVSKSISITGASSVFAGDLAMGTSSALIFSGPAATIDFSGLTGLSEGVGSTIIFASRAPAPQLFSPGKFTFPAIQRNDSGTTLLRGDLSVGSIIISRGAINAGANAVTVFNNLQIDGGMFDATDSKLSAQGNVCVNRGTLSAPRQTPLSVGGNWSIADSGAAYLHDSGTVVFTSATAGKNIQCGGSPFYAVVFKGATGASWTLLGDLRAVGPDSGFALFSGTLSLGTGRKATIAGAHILCSGGVLDFGKSSLVLTNPNAEAAFLPLCTVAPTRGGSFVFESGAAGRQQLTPGGQLFPTLRHNGRNVELLIHGDLSCDSLVVSQGTLSIDSASKVNIQSVLWLQNGNFSGGNAAISVNGSVLLESGTFTAPGSGRPFTVARGWTDRGTSVFDHHNGTVSFVSNFPGNSITIASAGEFNDLLFNGNGGEWTLDGDLHPAHLGLSGGALHLGRGNRLTLVASPVFSGGTIDFGSSVMVCAASLDFHLLANVATGLAGTLELNGVAETQIVRPRPNDTLPRIAHTGNGFVQLSTSPLIANGFSQMNGQFDFNGNDIAIVNDGDLNISNGQSAPRKTLSGLAGRHIEVDGNANLMGTPGNLLDLNPLLPWTITVHSGKILEATYATIGNATAAGSPGIAWCSDDSSGNGARANNGWLFKSGSIWKGGAANDYWSNPLNWYSGTVPQKTDKAIFDSRSGSQSCVIDSSDTVAGLIMSPGYSGSFSFGTNGAIFSVTGDIDMRSGGPIVAGNGTLACIANRSTPQILIPPRYSLPRLLQNGPAGTQVILNHLRAGSLILTSGSFDLGTGQNDTIGVITGTEDTLSWGAATTLTINGENADFSGISTRFGDLDTLQFIYAGNTLFRPCQSGLLPTIKQNSPAGELSILSNCKAENLVVAAGTVALGNSDDSIGSLDGRGTLRFNNGRLRVGGPAARCSSLAIRPDSGTMEFVGSGNTQVFLPGPQEFPRTVCSGTGTVSLAGNLSTDSLCVRSGTLNLGAGRNHRIGDMVSTGGELIFGPCTLSIARSADFSGLSSVTYPLDAEVRFSGTVRDQILTPNPSDTLPQINHAGNQTLSLARFPLVAASFLQTDGSLDLNGNDITIVKKGNFTIQATAAAPLRGLAGRTITVGGNALLRGTALSGIVDLHPDIPWRMQVAGTLSADSVRVGNAIATKSAGHATNSFDEGNTDRWYFAVKWTGAGGGAWSAPESWNIGAAPTSKALVYFENNTISCAVDASIAVASLTLSNSYTGTWDLNGNKLTVSQGADFRSNKPVRPHGGSLSFNTDSGSYTLVPPKDSAFATISKSGSGTIAITNNPLLVAGEFSMISGGWNWGNGLLAHSVGSVAASGGSIGFGNASLQVIAGDADFRGAKVVAGAGILCLSKNGSQLLAAAEKDTLPRIIKSGGDTLRLSGQDLRCKALTVSMCKLDMSQTDTLSTVDSGDFVVSGGDSATFVGLGGRCIRVSGNALLSGKSGNLLNLNPGLSWRLMVDNGKSLLACLAEIGNCDASGPQLAPGRAGPGCVDKGGNSNWTFNQFAPLWRKTLPGAIIGGVCAGKNGFFISTTGNENAVYGLSSADGSVRWKYLSPYGKCSAPACWFSSMHWIYVTSGKYLLCRCDRGTYSTSHFVIDLKSTAGQPVVSDDSCLYVAAGGSLIKLSVPNGERQFATAVPDISIDMAPVASNGFVFVTTTAGLVLKIDAYDGTIVAGYAAGCPISQPLQLADSLLFLSPGNASVCAIHIGTMTEEFRAGPLPARVSGPILCGTGNSGLLVPAGNELIKIAGDSKSQTSGIFWKGGAGTTIKSSLATVSFGNNPVYFASSAGAYFAINGADGNSVSDYWPFSDGVKGEALSGPWIDLDAWVVIFGTTGGNLDAFSLAY